MVVAAITGITLGAVTTVVMFRPVHNVLVKRYKDAQEWARPEVHGERYDYDDIRAYDYARKRAARWCMYDYFCTRRAN